MEDTQGALAANTNRLRRSAEHAGESLCRHHVAVGARVAAVCNLPLVFGVRTPQPGTRGRATALRIGMPPKSKQGLWKVLPEGFQ